MTQLDGKSKDLINENIEKLKEIFPEVFSEGKIDFSKLEEELGTFKENENERYNFTWNGKSEAKKIALTPSTGTLRPCKEESKDWDTTQNLYIEGDNLEVLKLLQKSYHKKVKMIYIDPPYNTGKDFVYKDNFRDNIKNYLEITGQVDSDGSKLSTNSETSGRYHSDWLNMMYPRLKLARNLLKDEGVIFISIDDNEVANLRKLCDEIFGEDNFVADIIWERAFSPVNLKKHFSENHDFIIAYAKNIEKLNCNGLSRDEKSLSGYKNPDNDYRGLWTSGDLSVGPAIADNIYEIKTPSGRIVNPPNGYSWRLNKNRLAEFIADNRIWFGEKGDSVPRIKRFLSEVKNTITPMTIWNYKDVGHSQEAKQKLKELFDDKSYFDYPKSVTLINRILGLYVNKNDNDIILDFFSGSATTAHAVMKLNSEDDGNRKFICVQLPEPIDEKSEAFKAGYKNISEIGKERIRRAGEKVKTESGKDDLDIGFKVLKLDSSNIKSWDSDFENLETNLLDAVENIKSDRNEEDLLYEILLKYGLDLTLPIEEKVLNGKKLYNIGFGALIICLDNNISIDITDEIIAIKKEYDSEITRVVFKDSGFKNATEKTNIIKTLNQNGIYEVVSI
ncbi:site-specific DNA-methyltransferase [Aliarcobacter cryaerophilus]|uniref:site-specific DNA-methyltransferase n=1 Tax=Aliarcobacter cryaerophilus TaxID=28198 RepID=UPI00082A4CB7|nr:site-specific DNA-methyltransferase [Aliarcobacter cryaerophilus]